MTKQKDLLSDQPIARSTDPETSHLAAAEVTKSGKRATQQHECLKGVKRYPGRTSAELAAALHIDRYIVARRLPELREAGKVMNGPARPCGQTRRKAITWFWRYDQ